MTEQRLEPGAEAPEFSLPDIGGRPVSLSTFRGQQVIVYFYPAAMTPGCTKEACDFRDNLSRLTGAGLTVLGISKDTPTKLAKFRDKEGLTFPLLSDPGLEVHQAYGAYGEKTMYGKKTVGVIRFNLRDRPHRPRGAGVLQRQGHRARRTPAQRPSCINEAQVTAVSCRRRHQGGAAAGTPGP